MITNPLIVISGPTATGKTQISLDIAMRIKAHIVNFDSLLFYKELNIGTAKPSLEQRNYCPHHLIDITSISEPINAADFVRLAIPLINNIHEQKKPVILVGGSGFYLRALLKGMYPSKTPSEAITQRSNLLYQNEGIEAFLEILKIHDPASFQSLHPNDHYRIRRAVEHFWTTNQTFSDAKRKLAEQKKNSNAKKYQWNIYHAYLDLDKKQHQAKIETRTQFMLNQGLVKEVQGLMQKGFSGWEKPLNCIGYKEVLQFFKGDLRDEKELKEAIIVATRQLAKAQRTWFNKVDKIGYHPINDKQKLHHDITRFLGNA